MASVSRTPIGLGGTSASDFLRSSTNGVSGIPLNALGRVKLGLKRRDFTVASKLRRKVKKHDHPWPDNPDSNVKDVVLTHLSSFKPLKEKPKPVTLDFERPLVEIEINDVRKMANKTGLDFSDQILSLENKYQQALKYLYSHLTPIQRVNIARHPNRPTFLDHVYNITDKFVELHGDRAGYDDPAIVTGIGTIDGRRYMFMGHQKGRNTKENIKRNFGMPTPHGYRKALRMMYYADHHGFPIITFIDTPGAYADLKSEELGQGEAIAHNLRTMFGLKVPVISIVIGEGGSGGALAIGCANKLLMLENAVFYVASPEACAAILWKSAKASPKAAKKLKITAAELCKLQIANCKLQMEPVGGAHTDPSWTSQQIKFAINEAMDELEAMETEDLLRHRMLKFRKIGGFQEGIPIDPGRSFNMKKREQPTAKKIPAAELNSKVGKLKQQILNAKESSIKPQESDLNVMIRKMKAEIDKEYFKAVKALGLTDRLVKLREEFSKANSEYQLIDPAWKDKIEKLHEEINQRLSAAPNYGKLQDELDMLKKLSKVKFQSEKNKHAVILKQEFEAKFEEVINNPGIKKKYEALKTEIAASGQASPSNLDDELRNKIIEFKKELELELADAVKAAGLDVDIVKAKALDHAKETVSEIKSNQAELNKEIYGEIKTALNSSDLKSKMEVLKIEVAKAGKMPDMKSKNRIAALEQQIKRSLDEVIGASSLKQKYENLKSKISSNDEFYGDLHGNLNKEDELRVEVGINCTYV
ncbi:hypothetical protein L6164_000074 [Bauhinia variegata]|uniref:Uncharacterized protein n=1 Tax=Bauhinia variegata TaxID=167791 RepID=A0ACB9Q4X2_BAUVA|nr:hypothetical protein L6164_000074 [Bauhinia variegata]